MGGTRGRFERIIGAPGRFILFALIVAACGGGGDSGSSTAQDPNPDAISVTSDDGLATLQVPAGAVPAGSEISITVLDPVDLLDEFEQVKVAYELKPDGLVFDEPATLSIRQPGAALVDTVEVHFGVLQSDESVEPVGPQWIRHDGDDVVHVSPIDHFSTFLLVAGSIELRLTPPAVVDRSEGDSFDATVTSKSVALPEAGQGFGRRLALFEWSSTGSLAEPEAEPVDDEDDIGFWISREAHFSPFDQMVDPGRFKPKNTFTCHTAGPGEYRARVQVTTENSIDAYMLVGLRSSALVDLVGTARCGAADDPEDDGADSAESESESAGGDDGANDRPDPPDDIHPPIEIEVAQQGPCGWPPLYPPEGALLQPGFQRQNDTAYQRGEGYSLVLGSPHGAFVKFDNDGTLIAEIEPRGETPRPEWDLIEVTSTDTTITIVVDETRYDEGGPCTQRVTYAYTIDNTREIFDYMRGVPSDGVPEVGFDGVTANYQDGTFSMGGKLAFEDGVVVDLWLECSGLNLIEYRLVPVEVAADGTFRIEEELSDCVVVNIIVAANGNQVTRSSVSN
jgi:hypothetical protein